MSVVRALLARLAGPEREGCGCASCQRALDRVLADLPAEETRAA